MKKLLRLSVVFIIALLAIASLASAGAQESSGADGATLMDIFVPANCPQASGITVLAGPADGCCSRHATICEGICTCGLTSFNCWENGTGGCSSTCKCVKCI
jgi:hypothetical protein